MGNTCGTLNVHETAIVTTWTDKEIRHGPAGCFCYAPCVNSVSVQPMPMLKIHECAVVEDTRDPSKSKYIYGPLLFKAEHPYQKIGPIMRMPVLDQNDYIICVDKTGNKRIETGPKVVQMVFGETYSEIKEAINVNVNEYIVLLDKANNANPIRHIRGPAKVYPTPYEEIVPANDAARSAVRKCVEVNEATAIWLRQPDGQVILVEEPQFYMPKVGEVVERTINKTLLKESEFCILIMPSGQNVLRRGNQANQRAFFLPPFHRFLPFRMGQLQLDLFHTLPDFIPLTFTIRTSDNVQVKVDMRISFQIFDPETYTKKPVDFHTQISYWVQNELLDAFAQQNFRDFLKNYAAIARSVTEASHRTFSEFGIRVLDVQLIHFTCLDPATQKLLDQDIITRVTKQNELLAKEADVDIMKREKEVQLQRMEIDYEKSIKENEMQLKKKELDVHLRVKEVDLQIAEETKRQELMEIKKKNVVQEGEFEGLAQGRAVAAFMDALPQEFAPDQKLSVWSHLRELERAAMLYSKVNSIDVYPPGADLKRLEINVEAGKAEKFLNSNPLMLPSILSYSGEQGLMRPGADDVEVSAGAASSSKKKGSARG